MTPLEKHLEANTQRLNAAAVAEMYRDPFWEERFGERGRRFSAEDGAFHLKYLQQALAANDARLLENYARWLQSVLTARGMCSLHLDQHFERLAAILSTEPVDASAAVALLRRAREALHYPAGPARELQNHAAALESAVRARLNHSQLAVQAPTLLSFLSDALALGRPELFSRHVLFLEEFSARRGVGKADVAGLLKAVEAALGDVSRISPETRSAALATIQAAQ